MSEVAREYAGRRVVVTGAGGFLGKRLVARLSELGCDVIALSRAGGFDLLKSDLRMEGVDHLFHLAAETGVPDSWNDPVGFHLVNAHGTVRMLDHCHHMGCSFTLVGAYIYGVPAYLPIDEEHPLDANNPYAFSKLMAEQACEWYSRIYDIPVAAVRLFNVFGSGQSNRFVITRIIEQVLDPRVSEIELMDLAPRRDYLFVDDAIEALLHTKRDSGYRVYNVGSGSSYSVAEVAQSVMHVAGVFKEIRVVGEPRRNEIPDVRADYGRLSDESGWRPVYSLHDGIRKMLSEAQS